jgi:hypothetical protein
VMFSQHCIHPCHNFIVTQTYPTCNYILRTCPVVELEGRTANMVGSPHAEQVTTYRRFLFTVTA